MEKFYIDRQFGQAILVEVDENDIVIRVYNDSQMEKKMNENYAGKSIFFLKEDFEKRMKPCFFCVKSWKDHDSFRIKFAEYLKKKQEKEMIEEREKLEWAQNFSAVYISY